MKKRSAFEAVVDNYKNEYFFLQRVLYLLVIDLMAYFVTRTNIEISLVISLVTGFILFEFTSAHMAIYQAMPVSLQSIIQKFEDSNSWFYQLEFSPGTKIILMTVCFIESVMMIYLVTQGMAPINILHASIFLVFCTTAISLGIFAYSQMKGS